MTLGNEIALKRELSARVGVIITCSRRWAVLTMPNNSFKPTPLRGAAQSRRYTSASGRKPSSIAARAEASRRREG